MSMGFTRASMETQPPRPAVNLILPDDMLAGILDRLAARTLAACHCVCAAWRDLIDDHRLLLRRLLPHSAHGIFLYDNGHRHSHLFTRPTAEGPPPRFSDELGINSDGWLYSNKYGRVVDHCNGLVLYTNSTPAMFVCNPATRRWAKLPACPDAHWNQDRCAYLAFDPVTSPHYEVLVAPHVPAQHHAGRLMEWPPLLWTWHVFSSKGGQWGERTFVREGEAAGTVGSLQLNTNDPAWAWWFSATYWQGTLYVHFRRKFVLRMPLSSDQKYRVIKTPICQDDSYNGASTLLGKSEKGMQFATIHHTSNQLRVWILQELHNNTEWVLMHQIDLRSCVSWARILASTAEVGDLEQQCSGSSWLLDVCTAGSKKTTYSTGRDLIRSGTQMTIMLWMLLHSILKRKLSCQVIGMSYLVVAS